MRFSNNMVCAISKASDQPAHTLKESMTVRLLSEHHLEFLSLKGGCTVYSCQNATMLEITCRGSLIAACDPSDFIMDHRNFNISSRMEESKER